VGDLKLDRMRALLARLGDPHLRQRIVHVAGSKGKGSTSAMLASILRRAGYRTGLFTSPHLCRVEERFQVDGVPITRDELRSLLRDIRAAAADLGPRGVTFFEVATAAGFLHFERRRADAVVLEVGLGGRFDSTNVCLPLVAAITSISFDHTKLLGDQLAAIAFEKAGIIKPGRPAVSGTTVPEPQAVVERICRERRAPLHQLGVDFHYRYAHGWVSALETRRPRVEVTTRRRRWPSLELNLHGDHQAANAAVAVACVEILRDAGLHLTDAAVAAGLAEVVWPARLEVVGRQPLAVLDCAHNVASAEALTATLESSFAPRRRLLVFAGSTDKDLPGMFRVLARSFDRAYLTRYTNNPRAAPPEDLLGYWQAAAGGPAAVHATPAEAWQAALNDAGPEDLVCATGSVFLAGELRGLLAPGA
jgi:dihydrofolate synthase/folylpolyglutamate synthase